MAACDLIRTCSSQVGNLWNQLNNSQDAGTRTQIGNQITRHVSKCVAAAGRPNEQIGPDLIYFPAPYNTTYDVIENMKGTKGPTARVSCHKIAGRGGDVPPIPPNGSGFPGSGLLPGTNQGGYNIGGLQISNNMLLVGGILLLILIIKK